MTQEQGHHHHDQTLHPDKTAEGKVLKEAGCGMDVDKDNTHHTEQGGGKICFCSENCLKKFKENPSVYRVKIEGYASCISFKHGDQESIYTIGFQKLNFTRRQAWDNTIRISPQADNAVKFDF